MLQKLKSLLSRRPKNPYGKKYRTVLPDRPAETWDYRRHRCGWGHNIVVHEIIEAGQMLRVSGFGSVSGKRPCIDVGDYILLSHDKKDGGGETRYQVIAFQRLWNPSDMWSAYLKFAPRGAK